ncbi:unnamed protein product [Alopecurus aequalis]
MLRLRRSILTNLLSSPSASPISHLHRLLSAAAAAVSPSPGFNVEDYLVERCGLSRAQAPKASAKISHLNSSTNPDAVLAFLDGLGFSSADVTAIVASDPKFLCAGVDKTLSPIVVGLNGLGLSSSEVARLVSAAPDVFRRRSIVSNLQHNLEKIVKPNIAVLRECGLSDCGIAKLSIAVPRLLTNNPKRFQAIVACAEGLGVPRGAPMFRHALHAVAYDSEEMIAAKLEYLKKTFRWSDAEVGIAVSRAPSVLTKSEDMLQGRSDFLIAEVGLEPTYIAHRPAILSYSLEGRVRPRHYVPKFLKENRLIEREASYYTSVLVTEKVFAEKFIRPHKEAAPHLAEDYAAACRGKVPANFIFA